MSPTHLRRQRQLTELRDLCRRGLVGRAIDLAFEHFACFGHDDDVVVLLEQVVAETPVSRDVRQRLVALRDVQR